MIIFFQHQVLYENSAVYNDNKTFICSKIITFYFCGATHSIIGKRYEKNISFLKTKASDLYKHQCNPIKIY